MRVLDRKLLRDLWGTKGQALAIALVIAAGIAMFIAYLSNFGSLRASQAEFYDRNRFGDVFAGLVRAPRHLERRIEAIPGVARADTRVVADVLVDVPGLDDPATARLIAVPVPRSPTLNDITLRTGRWLVPGRADEVIASEAFTEANELSLGDEVRAVVNGRRRRLRIVGTALSPEYVYSIRPGELIPDDRRFGVLWMERRALASAFDMEGAFNDVSLALAPGASEAEVMARLDELLRPHGGRGAIPRALQVSHWSVDMELAGLQLVGFILPIVFLGIAAFLLNVTLGRIVTVQKEQIAALKALGRANSELALHYGKWSLLVAAVGCALGIVFGALLGSGMLSLYARYFRFPGLELRLTPAVVLAAVAFSLVAAVVGAVAAVRRAVTLPPAEAMRPEPPADYRPSWIERLGFQGFLSPPARMVLRNLHRNPRRSLLSVLGISLSVGMLVVGLFFIDAMDVMIDIQFNAAQREDVTVAFVEPLSASARHDLERLPGVSLVEPARAVAVRLRAGHRQRQVALEAIPEGARLRRLVDTSGRRVEPASAGLTVSAKLAEVLGIVPGDVVTLEVLEGARPVRQLPVHALIDEYMGMTLYAEAGTVHRLLREAGSLTGGALAVDRARWGELNAAVKEIPAIAGMSSTTAILSAFEDTIAENINIMIFFNVLFASVIAFGVVYNAARISLSERSRELASLRVLGFTRREISAILLGELAAVTVFALPVGLALGYLLAALVAMAYDTELYRFPLVVSARTQAGSALVVAAAAALSGLAVRRRLDRLDLVAVLKTRE